ncbi:MAG TPA: hypothetical protein VIY29_23425, partial [Ktedonobacteraceae bacterium]
LCRSTSSPAQSLVPGSTHRSLGGAPSGLPPHSEKKGIKRPAYAIKEADGLAKTRGQITSRWLILCPRVFLQKD